MPRRHKPYVDADPETEVDPAIPLDPIAIATIAGVHGPADDPREAVRLATMRYIRCYPLAVDCLAELTRTGKLPVAANANVSAGQPANGLLTRAQVANMLGVCAHTVARNKHLVPVKFNSRLVRYHASDVQRLIAKATV